MSQSEINAICHRIYNEFLTGKRKGTLGDFIAALDEELKFNNIKIDALEISTDAMVPTNELECEISLEKKG